MKNFVLFFLLSFSIEGVFGETVSVIDGDSVTLHTGLTKIQEDDVLEWRFGAGRDRIVRARKDSDPKYDDVLGGRFRDRLKLDRQTGDLTITNITTKHTGLYEISINAIALRTFTLNVVSGVDEVKSVSVGDSVTLNSGTNIQRDDVIQWRFLNSSIAEHNRKTVNFSTSDGPDEIFRHRLQLDYSTGSLTIKNIETKHSGHYEAVIRKNSGYTVHQSYNVTVRGERKFALSVMKGYDVTLHTDLTEIHTADLMLWMFEDSVIADINKAQNRFSTSDDVPDGRFRDRLKLDEKTGNLNITDTTTEHTGLYELEIISSRFTINKRITVSVTDPALSAGEIAWIVVGVLLLFVAAAVAGVIYYRCRISKLIQEWINKGKIQSVKEGEDITLTPDDTDVHKNNKLVWMFRSNCLAVKKSIDQSFHVHDDGPDGEFKGRLHLDPQTGSLTITKTQTTDTGVYELVIIRLGMSSIKRFRVSVFAETSVIEPVPVKEGGSVILPSGVTDIQTIYEILWTCGLYTPLAKITRETKEILPSADIFKGRLKLDHKTGSLTINKIKPTDAGIYMLRITGGNIKKTHLFRVSFSVNNPEENSVTNPTDNRNNPEEVPLNSVAVPDSRL